MCNRQATVGNNAMYSLTRGITSTSKNSDGGHDAIRRWHAEDRVQYVRDVGSVLCCCGRLLLARAEYREGQGSTEDTCRRATSLAIWRVAHGRRLHKKASLTTEKCSCLAALAVARTRMHASWWTCGCLEMLVHLSVPPVSTTVRRIASTVLGLASCLGFGYCILGRYCEVIW